MASFSFRPLTEADIPFAMRLKDAAGWNQTETDWRRYIALEPEGCFLALDEGEPAGTVTTVTYGRRLGWIGMVLVHPERRRKGIGTALMGRAIDYLRSAGIDTIALDATAEGKPVYQRLGFSDDYEVVRYAGTAPRAEPGRSLEWDDISDLCRFDARCFGANRSRVVRLLFADCRNTSFVVRSDGNVAGYIMARPGTYAWNIGPWVSQDPQIAELLFRHVCAAIAGCSAVVDVPAPNAAGHEICARYGFAPSRRFTRMFFGTDRIPIDPMRIFSGAGAEKG